MNTPESKLARFAAHLGMLTFIAWVLLIGGGGFLVLCGLSYALVAENLALQIVCGLLFVVPWALSIAWVATAGASLLEERQAKRARQELTEGVFISEKSPQHP